MNIGSNSNSIISNTSINKGISKPTISIIIIPNSGKNEEEAEDTVEAEAKE